jgi:hypothetical protein
MRGAHAVNGQQGSVAAMEDLRISAVFVAAAEALYVV